MLLWKGSHAILMQRGLVFTKIIKLGCIFENFLFFCQKTNLHLYTILNLCSGILCNVIIACFRISSNPVVLSITKLIRGLAFFLIKKTGWSWSNKQWEHCKECAGVIFINCFVSLLIDR